MSEERRVPLHLVLLSFFLFNGMDTAESSEISPQIEAVAGNRDGKQNTVEGNQRPASACEVMDNFAF